MAEKEAAKERSSSASSASSSSSSASSASSASSSSSSSPSSSSSSAPSSPSPTRQKSAQVSSGAAHKNEPQAAAATATAAAAAAAAAEAPPTPQAISSQSFKIITQYGDMLVVKQSLQSSHHHHHHHHHQHQQPHHHHHQQPHQHHYHSHSHAHAHDQQPNRPIIMTFHDLGLNSELQFAAFFECHEVRLLLQTFTIVHVNFIGQEFESSNGGAEQSAADSLPDDFKYPTVEQMAECIVDVCAQMRIRSFVALAVGAGAHIVSTLALIRPDLVHGLFLINPVVASCSITEWLYFKMSAIASNHQTGAGSSHASADSGSSGPPTTVSSSDQTSTAELEELAASSASDSAAAAAAAVGVAPPPKAPVGETGLRRLLHAMHLPHRHHNNRAHAHQQHHRQHHQHQHQHKHARHSHHANRPHHKAAHLSRGHNSDGDGDDATSREPSVSSTAPAAAAATAPSSARSTPEPAAGGLSTSSASSSRLRQLILSRNFRLAGAQSSGGSARSNEHTCARDSRAGDLELASGRKQSDSGAGAKHAPCQGAGAAAAAAEPAGGRHPPKRAPIEYLMYHHFGSGAFRRVRRPSDTPAVGGVGGGGGGESPVGASRRSHSRDSADQSSSSPATRSIESAASRQQCWRNKRANSVCLSASYLASFSSERQRANYMQSVYRHYFEQVNAHNLWLFAQSFARRRALNLRKDCGAAAHAAAAAAALGTSICAAFIGGSPAQAAHTSGPPAGSGSSAFAPPCKSAAAAPEVAGGDAPKLPPPRQPQTPSEQPTNNNNNSAAAKQAEQTPLVAGTKVKRTFTCQTLIMCSSVQMHCERALKLMSLLNPLQATWIKIDHLLVLEERPDKVCQVLRLFLQGIGYSMSTYERRLRLNSAHASASSADSTGSMRSLANADKPSAPV